MQSLLTKCLSLQPHPASAAAAAVLVAHASSLGQGQGSNTKYNADGSSYAVGPNQIEQGLGQAPPGLSPDVITANPLLRQQTMGPVSHRLTLLALDYLCAGLHSCTMSVKQRVSQVLKHSRTCCVEMQLSMLASSIAGPAADPSILIRRGHAPNEVLCLVTSVCSSRDS